MRRSNERAEGTENASCYTYFDFSPETSAVLLSAKQSFLMYSRPQHVTASGCTRRAQQNLGRMHSRHALA